MYYYHRSKRDSQSEHKWALAPAGLHAGAGVRGEVDGSGLPYIQRGEVGGASAWPPGPGELMHIPPEYSDPRRA